MSTETLRDLIDDEAQLWPLSVEQYHKMIATGMLPEGEPYELLEGHLVRKDRSATGEDPMTVGHDHAAVVRRLAKLNAAARKVGCFIQTQQPITLPPFDEPEPDAAIIRGTEEDYDDRHPGADDVLCVFEVADASLRRDRTVKLRTYAKCALPQYVIINLPDRCAELYTQPLPGQGRYGRSITLSPSQKLVLAGPTGKQLTIPLRRLWPSLPRQRGA